MGRARRRRDLGCRAVHAHEVGGRLADSDRVARAIGITNQRETVVAWDRHTGDVLHRAIVWQDRRTADACRRLTEEGHLPMVRERTGLVLDPYFSATKMRWLLDEGGVPRSGGLALATVDTWVLWNLTGGTDGGVFATDATNASRTLLYDIVVRRWSPELGALFDVPLTALPEVRPSCGRFGRVGRRRARFRLPARRSGDQRDRRGSARRPLRSGLLRPGDDQGRPSGQAASSS